MTELCEAVQYAKIDNPQKLLGKQKDMAQTSHNSKLHINTFYVELNIKSDWSSGNMRKPCSPAFLSTHTDCQGNTDNPHPMQIRPACCGRAG